MPSGFNIGGHARASTVLHELGHINSKTVDFATLEARRPFTDLISSLTSFGANLKSNQLTFQREALSLLTPEEKLFARWDGNEDEWVDVDEIEGMERISEKILEVTGARTIAEAKTAFLDPVNPAVRINVILRNADSLALLIGEMGRQLDPVSVASTSKN